MKSTCRGEVSSPEIKNKGRGNPAPTLFQQGYAMPAEWGPHEATWLSWPHNEETWPGQLKEVEEVYLQMLEALLPGEKVYLLVNDESEREKVAKRVASKKISDKNLIYFMIPTVDAWIRDYGPAFVVRKIKGRQEIAAVKWIFNAWGGKYESLAHDNSAGERIVESLNIPCFRPGFILEGGSVDTNGEGTVLVTEQCLLNADRNPGLSREGVEEKLRDFLGFNHFIWLGDGVEGDDTDGHIDDITRFVNPNTIVTASEENPDDPNASPLQKNLKKLRRAKDQNGKPLNLVTLPMPGRIEGSWGRAPASYLNFYIANGVVLVPIFGQPRDWEALKILKDLFPKRRIVGIRSETLVLGLGGIHCVTHEQPEAQ